MDCMELLLGVKYFEIVILIADPSSKLTELLHRALTKSRTTYD